LLEVRENVPGVLQVIGSVDLGTVGDLREKLLSAVDRAVADEMPVLSLDLSEAELIDAAGLGVLLGAHRRARRGGSRLRLVRLSADLQHVLLVSRLYRVLDVENAEGPPPSAPADSVPAPRADSNDRRPLASP
jgi:anti-anti-sigma factor